MFVHGHTNIFTLLLLDGAGNFPSPLDTFFSTFLLHLPFGNEGGDVCADIVANLFGGAKGSRLSAISFVNATGISRDGKGQNGKGKGSHSDGLLGSFQQKN